MRLASRVLISSSDVRIHEQTQIPSKGLPGLVKGQVLQADVVQSGPQRQIQLRIQGKTVKAETFVPLNTGDKLTLSVAADGSQPVLKLVAVKTGPMHPARQIFCRASGHSAAYEALSNLLENLHDPENIHTASKITDNLLALKKVLHTLCLKSSDSKTTYVRDLIRGSGLSWESKLKSALSAPQTLDGAAADKMVSRDLKALAMQLLAKLDDGNENLLRDTRVFLDGLETLQILNRYGAETTNRFVLPLPVLWGEHLRFGQMLIDLGRKQNSTQAASAQLIRVAFCLDMSNLGDIQADFSILDHALSGTFAVSDERVCRWVKGNLAPLEQKFEKLGFSVQGIGCRVVAAETLANTNYMDRLIQSDDALLNVLI